MRHIRIVILVCFLTPLSSAAFAQADLSGNWHVEISNPHYGSLETILHLEEDLGAWSAETQSLVLRIEAGSDEHLTGHIAIGGEAPATFEAQAESEGTFVIELGSGSLHGEWQFTRTDADALDRDYGPLYQAMSAIMQQWVFDPRLLQDASYVAFDETFAAAAANAKDDVDLITGFDEAWDGTLFSHFEILRPRNTMEGLLAEADDQAEDRPVARFELLNPDVALVTIETFFGLEIEQQIDAAMGAAIESAATNLIIDLRDNPGGTTSAIPVGTRIIHEPATLGYFLANSWWQQNDGLPSQAVLDARPFMNDRDRAEMMQELVGTGLISARIAPVEPIFDGNVYILISERTGSAAEGTAGMIKASGRATLIGETTAGRMLNSNFFPLPNDFTLRVPIADFYLVDGTRIDGVGVVPNVEVPDEEALDEALRLISAGG